MASEVKTLALGSALVAWGIVICWIIYEYRAYRRYIRHDRGGGSG